jgi:hypothetical protein
MEKTFAACISVLNEIQLAHQYIMTRTNFYFPESLLERLKAAKDKTGVPVSEIMRRAVDAYLKELGI